MAAKEKIMKLVLRMVEDATFVHCYLNCGHLITVDSKEFKTLPSHRSIECWACEAEAESKKADEKRFRNKLG